MAIMAALCLVCTSWRACATAARAAALPGAPSGARQMGYDLWRPRTNALIRRPPKGHTWC